MKTPPLVYLRRIGDSHRESPTVTRHVLCPAQRQPVLDELEGRLQAEQKGMKSVYDEISLISPVSPQNRGSQPNLGSKSEPIAWSARPYGNGAYR